MEKLSSRQNKYIRHLKALSADRAYRALNGEYICDGEKLLEDAVSSDAEITSVLWCERAGIELGEGIAQYLAPADLINYASPLKETQGPLFTVRIRGSSVSEGLSNAIVLERVQDPGNVGTIIRTAHAFGIDAVILVNDCADPYNPKTVRSAMGALFRQTVIETKVQEAVAVLNERGIPIYGTSLSGLSRDVREVDLHGAAVVIGNEGSGISPELLAMCGDTLVIPMEGNMQSLNAAVSAAIVMWEMTR